MDADRTALYAAELAAFDGTDLERGRPYSDLVALADSIAAGEWWPGPEVKLRRARADARTSSARCALGSDGGSVTIRLAANQLTVATLAHELAHALAGADRGHDAIFRTAYLDVIAVITNLDSTDRRRSLHVDQLRDALSAAGLVSGQRRWPSPPSSANGAIAL